MKSILSIILLLAAALLFFFFTKPKITELKSQQLEVQKLEAAIANARKLDSRIDALTKTKNSISQADRDKMQIMLPDNVENVKLIIDFDKMLQAMVEERGTLNLYKGEGQGASKKVSIESPKITQSTGASQFNSTIDSSKLGVANLSFSVDLTYSDFLEFLNRIEHSKRIMDIESIDFSTPELGAAVINAGNVDPVYSFNISLKTYWLRYETTNNIDHI
ncbi:MAG: hypothetical protein RJB39_620 [Candidatus Parcubacteria bacterium]|jgi:hypothetical protein